MSGPTPLISFAVYSTDMLTFAELTNFLKNAHWPQISERRPTFFSITGFPHYENVISNVYQFFFSTGSPHGLDSLCLDALFEVVGEAKKRNGQQWQQPTLRRVSVERELSTGNGRLDLLLHDAPEEGQWKDASALILIENKIYHWLANDLNDYWRFVTPENQECQKLGVVLGLKREIIPLERQSEWVAIRHLEWAQAVERRLGPLIYRAENRYLVLLLELIENIKTMSEAQENAHELIYFFRRHHAEIACIQNMQRQLLDVVPNEIRRVLPSYYSLEGQAKASKIDTWLTIKSFATHSSSSVKYLIQYGGLTRDIGQGPSYQIWVITHDLEKAERMRVAYQQAELPPGISTGNRHYVICKRYDLTNEELKTFAEHIVESLKSDWMPLESIWAE